jgi:hypothetical protein
MIIPGQFGFNCPSGFREEAFWNIFPIGSNVKITPAVAAILNFILGKCSNAFFFETANMIEAKLYMNVHWMVFYKHYVFCFDMKFKMLFTAGLSLTLEAFWNIFPIGSNVKLSPADHRT